MDGAVWWVGDWIWKVATSSGRQPPGLFEESFKTGDMFRINGPPLPVPAENRSSHETHWCHNHCRNDKRDSKHMCQRTHRISKANNSESCHGCNEQSRPNPGPRTESIKCRIKKVDQHEGGKANDTCHQKNPSEEAEIGTPSERQNLTRHNTANRKKEQQCRQCDWRDEVSLHGSIFNTASSHR